MQSVWSRRLTSRRELRRHSSLAGRELILRRRWRCEPGHRR